MIGDSSDSSDSSYSHSDDSVEEQVGCSWIEWFTSHKRNQVFVEIDEDYIQDGFNMTGFHQMVPYYDQALAVILDEEEQEVTGEERVQFESLAEILYGLVHARFILTQKGMNLMMQKYKENVFGTCPSVSCEGARCMPIATTDVHGQEGGKIYCPRCKEIYSPRNQSLMQVDGSFFGTSFAPFFFLVNSHLVPPIPPKPYVPKIYGFRVHPSVRVFGRAAQYREREEEEKRLKELRDAEAVEQGQAQGPGGEDYGPMPAQA